MRFEIFKFESVTSTNDRAIKLIKEEEKEIGCVYAINQTKGRGTHGRKWISDKGNLFGCMEFSLECIKTGIQPIVSCNLNVIDQNYEIGDVLFSVCNSNGYENLSKLVSLSFLGKNRANKLRSLWWL